VSALIGAFSGPIPVFFCFFRCKQGNLAPRAGCSAALLRGLICTKLGRSGRGRGGVDFSEFSRASTWRFKACCAGSWVPCFRVHPGRRESGFRRHRHLRYRSPPPERQIDLDRLR